MLLILRRLLRAALHSGRTKILRLAPNAARLLNVLAGGNASVGAALTVPGRIASCAAKMGNVRFAKRIFTSRP